MKITAMSATTPNAQSYIRFSTPQRPLVTALNTKPTYPTATARLPHQLTCGQALNDHQSGRPRSTVLPTLA